MLTGCIIFGIVVTIVAVRAYRYAQCRIKAMSGVEQNCYVDVRGTKQYMQFRGNNVNNPIILILNPGNSILQNFTTYRFRRDLTDDYTVVYWDQRGCGRTYITNKRGVEVKYEEVLKDLDVVVDYLCKRFHREKIILLGYDWGTLLGVEYISKHPEKVQAYVSVEQFLDIKETLVRQTESAMNLYEKKKRKGAHLMFHLFLKFDTGKVLGKKEFAHYFTFTGKLANKLYPVTFAMKLRRFWQVVTSPDLELIDLPWIFRRLFFYYSYLQIFDQLITKTIQVNLVESFGYEFEVPFYLLYGERDYFVSPEIITDFYQNLKCPRKNLIELLHCGHEPFFDDPASFCSALKNILNEVR